MAKNPDEFMEQLRALKSNGGMTPLVTQMMLFGLIRLLQRKGAITAEDLNAEIGMFLSISTLPPQLADAVESAMLLTDETLLDALFFGASPST